jgi:hypothetical protein
VVAVAGEGVWIPEEPNVFMYVIYMCVCVFLYDMCVSMLYMCLYMYYIHIERSMMML